MWKWLYILNPKKISPPNYSPQQIYQPETHAVLQCMINSSWNFSNFLANIHGQIWECNHYCLKQVCGNGFIFWVLRRHHHPITPHMGQRHMLCVTNSSWSLTTFLQSFMVPCNNNKMEENKLNWFIEGTSKQEKNNLSYTNVAKFTCYLKIMFIEKDERTQTKMIYKRKMRAWGSYPVYWLSRQKM